MFAPKVLKLARTRIHEKTALGLALGLALAAGCSGSSGGGSEPTSNVDLLIQDTPSQELASFTAVIDRLHLVDGNGDLSANLILAPLPVEFLGLRDRYALCGSADVGRRVWTHVEVTFDGQSVEARAKDGADVPVITLAKKLTVALTEPLDLTDGHGCVAVDLDLETSLKGQLFPDVLGFQPSGTATGAAPAAVELDEVKGVVSSTDPANFSFGMEAYVDDDVLVPARNVTVELDPAVFLGHQDGSPFGSPAAFFADLTPGTTLLEVRGSLEADGTLHAMRCNVEDQQAGAAADSRVKIEGSVVDLTAPGFFELALHEVEQGTTVADPLLTGLGDPKSVTVSYDPATPFFVDGNGVATSAALALGQRVKVRFQDFTAEPFPADSVDILTQPLFDARVVDASGLPASVVCRLAPSTYGIATGQVESETTDVTVDLTSASFFLHLPHRPALQATDLRADVKVQIAGDLTGPPDTPLITASRVRVLPGRYIGRDVVPFPVAGAFEAVQSGGARPFGDRHPVVGALIAPDCAFVGAATTQADFFNLFGTLLPGEEIQVGVHGIGTGNDNEVLAYQVESRIEVD